MTYNLLRRMNDKEKMERGLEPARVFWLHIRTCQTLEEVEQVKAAFPKFTYRVVHQERGE